jgi:hypothetical protein
MERRRRLGPRGRIPGTGFLYKARATDAVASIASLAAGDTY